jgi:ATP-dependent 26S proteasome regulatory subunit
MTAPQTEFVAFSPALTATDATANYWLRQAMLRLRREVCWAWRERTEGPPAGAVPPFVDRLSESLNHARCWEDKQRFFETDVTARYLTAQIDSAPPRHIGRPDRGSFGWVEREVPLAPLDSFALALGLLAAFDSAAEPVIAACHNDVNRTSPTLGLVQKLWDRPEEVLELGDAGRPLFRYGLLRKAETLSTPFDWDAPIYVPEIVARRLLLPGAPPPSQLERAAVSAYAAPELPDAVRAAALRLRAPSCEMRVVPLRIACGAAAAHWAARVGEVTGRPIVELRGATTAHGLSTFITLCWLDGADLLLTPAFTPEKARLADVLVPLAQTPVNVFIAYSDHAALEGVPYHLMLAPVEAPPLDYTQRIECWKRALGSQAERLAPTIAEVSRRFRYESTVIERIAEGLLAAPGAISPVALAASCRAAARLELSDLAQRITPRFDSAADMFLPARQRAQFQEVLQAMRGLTEVHYRWGAARVWNEAGISVLFAGSPGTGKTMAAEVLASELDLPMYRIDLSQVVNKYIGETEKNLKRIFDAADGSDALLFFDEADSIFGKRMEARDAHDRYANLEISYLLDRMERFKGLAVLATNRKKDLDEAFLRRLRYVIEFPLPGPKERLDIWKQSIPGKVHAEDVDLPFLADRFPLAGGHIRSIVFNACLQSVGRGSPPRLRMEEVLVAVKRELEKAGHPIGLEAYGRYASLIRELDHEDDHN